MKAVVYHGIGDIRLEDVAEPTIKDDTDAIVRITASAICGTDLHFVRGTVPGMKEGTILGHEAVGVVEEVGRGVRNLRTGDRVVIPSTVACGSCSYCRAGYYAQCDQANPGGKRAGTTFFGGPKNAGALDGLQAETAYFGAALAEITPGDTVTVFGCGPVGQFAIASALLRDAGRVIAVDCVASRLEMARAQGAEVVNFERENPPEVILELTSGIGVDRVIDAVGVDAQHPHGGPGAKQAKQEAKAFERELAQVAPEQHPQGDNWHPGDGPSQALRWGVASLAKAGTHAIIGVYPEAVEAYPIGKAMNMNLTVKMGNCNHRKYIPRLVRLVASGAFDPTKVLTQREPLTSVLAAYQAFDTRQPGWIKVELRAPEATRRAAA